MHIFILPIKSKSVKFHSLVYILSCMLIKFQFETSFNYVAIDMVRKLHSNTKIVKAYSCFHIFMKLKELHPWWNNYLTLHLLGRISFLKICFYTLIT